MDNRLFTVPKDLVLKYGTNDPFVIAGNMHEDALREGGEIRADIEPVAGAVLPGQLDFGASVGHKALDLLDNALGGIAFESPLHEVRAAERAGIEATFLDIHDAYERGLAQGAGGGFALLQRGDFL